MNMSDAGSESSTGAGSGSSTGAGSGSSTGAGGESNTGASDQIVMAVKSPDESLSETSDNDYENCPSSPDLVSEKCKTLMTAAMRNRVTAQLGTAGPAGSSTGAGGESNTGASDQIVMAVKSPDESLSETSDNDYENCPSSPDLLSEKCKTLMTAAMRNRVTAQLGTAGPAGVAAAAAIVSAKKRQRQHSFEINPVIRKKKEKRLSRKLRQNLDELARADHKAAIFMATPGEPNNYRVFGDKLLTDELKKFGPEIIEEMERALAQHAPPPAENSTILK